jgi:hypothetical protein
MEYFIRSLPMLQRMAVDWFIAEVIAYDYIQGIQPL